RALAQAHRKRGRAGARLERRRAPPPHAHAASPRHPARTNFPCLFRAAMLLGKGRASDPPPVDPSCCCNTHPIYAGALKETPSAYLCRKLVACAFVTSLAGRRATVSRAP